MPDGQGPLFCLFSRTAFLLASCILSEFWPLSRIPGGAGISVPRWRCLVWGRGRGRDVRGWNGRALTGSVFRHVLGSWAPSVRAVVFRAGVGLAGWLFSSSLCGCLALNPPCLPTSHNVSQPQPVQKSRSRNPAAAQATRKGRHFSSAHGRRVDLNH